MLFLWLDQSNFITDGFNTIVNMHKNRTLLHDDQTGPELWEFCGFYRTRSHLSVISVQQRDLADN